MTPVWNAPQGVENVHTLCADKPKSDDRCNTMYISVKPFERGFGPEKRYIRTSYYYYYLNTVGLGSVGLGSVGGGCLPLDLDLAGLGGATLPSWWSERGGDVGVLGV